MNIPPAIVPLYRTREPNQLIQLYSGPIDIIQHTSTYSGPGTLQLQWHPYPGIGFNWQSDNLCPQDVLEGLRISLPELGVSARGYAISLPYWGGGEVEGYLEDPIELGDGQGLTEVLFHLINFHNYQNGSPVRYVSNEYESSWLGRLLLEGQEWRVTIDSINDSYSLIEEIQSKRGYAITHVGKLERIDNSEFTVKEANRILEALFFFLSFMRGFWVAPILPVGFNSHGEEVWKSWGPHIVWPWHHVESWFPTKNPRSVSTLFSGFLKWFLNPIWNEPLRLAIQWYIESNLKAGGMFSSLPGAIVIEQVALEMLSWVRLVESEPVYNRKEFALATKFPAVDKLTLLLSRFNIPLSIPDELQSLLAQAGDNGWSTGPQALTAIRNRVVHSSPKSRDQIRDLPHLSILESWKLGLWYIELVLLSLFEHQDIYHNRLRRNRNMYDVEIVPWVRP